MSDNTVQIALCFGVSRILTVTAPEPIRNIDVHQAPSDDLLVVIETDTRPSASMIVHPNHTITMSAEAAGVVAEVVEAAG